MAAGVPVHPLLVVLLGGVAIGPEDIVGQVVMIPYLVTGVDTSGVTMVTVGLLPRTWHWAHTLESVDFQM